MRLSHLKILHESCIDTEYFEDKQVYIRQERKYAENFRKFSNSFQNLFSVILFKLLNFHLLISKVVIVLSVSKEQTHCV